MLPLIILTIASSAYSFGQSIGGQIVGTVVDPEGAVLPQALIRVTPAKSDIVASRVLTDRLGEFNIGPLAPGPYIIGVGIPGFRARTIEVALQEGEVTHLPEIRLDFAGCDAPGMICDSVLKNPPRPVRRGELTSRLGCEVDLAKNEAHCPAGATSVNHTRASDFRVANRGGHVYLIPLKGAAISAPNSSKQDCSDAIFSKAEIQIDGLGPGYDICVRTHQGYTSHVFLDSEVGPNSTEISLWQVTRKR